MSNKRLRSVFAAILIFLASTAPAATKPGAPVSLNPKNPHYFLFRGKPRRQRRVAPAVACFERFPAVLTLENVIHAGATIPRVLSNPGHEYAIYLDGNGPTEVLMDLPAGAYSAEWVSAGTGAIERLEKIESKGAVTVLESPEFSNGIALRLKKLPR